MKIVIVARGLTKGGVSRFVYEISTNLARIAYNHSVYLMCDNSCQFEKEDNIHVIRIETESKFFFDMIKSKSYLSDISPDVVIYPKNVIPITHRKSKWKKLNIIHDLGYFEPSLKAYPFWDTLFMRLNMQASCQVSDKVLAVSEFTKQDIVNKFGIEQNKIEVIGEGVNTDLFTDSETVAVDTPYFLYPGSLSPRKNIKRILEAFESISAAVPHYLYITGLKEWGDQSYLKHIEKSNNKIKLLGYVSEKQLGYLYSNADALIYPSLYEGFGLPILEAQAAGVPVITSSVSACPETAGEGALIVDPYSLEKISNAMLSIANDPELVKTLVEKGRENLKRFSWELTAKKIISVIESIN